MKLVSFTAAGRPRVGIVRDRGIQDLTARAGLNSFIDAIGQLDELRANREASVDFGFDEIEYLPVVPNPQRIICIGVNYRTHLQETGREPTANPMVFSRFASSQVGHGQPIIRPPESVQLDFEGELAVIIGKECRRVPAERAHEVIAGYSIYNDGSVRDWQRHTSQFIPGKNFPMTGAFGPHLATCDEIEDVTRSSLVTRLNGDEVQRAIVSDLLFGIPELISYCSGFTMLSPGDVIVTGTTGGVGAARKPPLWMKHGDVVEVEIDGIGLLRNPVIDEPEPVDRF